MVYTNQDTPIRKRINGINKMNSGKNRKRSMCKRCVAYERVEILENCWLQILARFLHGLG